MSTDFTDSDIDIDDELFHSITGHNNNITIGNSVSMSGPNGSMRINGNMVTMTVPNGSMRINGMRINGNQVTITGPGRFLMSVNGNGSVVFSSINDRQWQHLLSSSSSSSSSSSTVNNRRVDSRTSSVSRASSNVPNRDRSRSRESTAAADLADLQSRRCRNLDASQPAADGARTSTGSSSSAGSPSAGSSSTGESSAGTSAATTNQSATGAPSDDTGCPACLSTRAEIQSNGEHMVCLTRCGHITCSVCIREVVRAGRCPVCRGRVSPRRYVRIYL